jgi:hypothetical protein
MRAADAAGHGRDAHTCRIWRVASQNLTASDASNAAAKTSDSAKELLATEGEDSMAASVGLRESAQRRTPPGSPMTDTDIASPATLARHESNLIWIDLEMTGLLPDSDRIIEIAVVVTDPLLAVRIEGPVFAIHQSDATLDAMDAWNKGTHGRAA